MKGTMSEQPSRDNILRRIERERAAHKRSRIGNLLGVEWPFLNNFHCRLPGGLYRAIFEDMDLDEAYADARASRKLRAMTPRAFFAHIDRLIAELGLDTREIARLQNAQNGEIYDYVFPLYIRLREEGFKHYPDLTS